MIVVWAAFLYGAARALLGLPTPWRHVGAVTLQGDDGPLECDVFWRYR